MDAQGQPLTRGWGRRWQHAMLRRAASLGLSPRPAAPPPHPNWRPRHRTCYRMPLKLCLALLLAVLSAKRAAAKGVCAKAAEGVFCSKIAMFGTKVGHVGDAWCMRARDACQAMRASPASVGGGSATLMDC